MYISYTMDLNQLAERMGNATLAEAAHMRESLASLGAWNRTEDVSEAEWHKLCDAAVAQAKHDD